MGQLSFEEGHRGSCNPWQRTPWATLSGFPWAFPHQWTYFWTFRIFYCLGGGQNENPSLWVRPFTRGKRCIRDRQKPEVCRWKRLDPDLRVGMSFKASSQSGGLWNSCLRQSKLNRREMLGLVLVAAYWRLPISPESLNLLVASLFVVCLFLENPESMSRLTKSSTVPVWFLSRMNSCKGLLAAKRKLFLNMFYGLIEDFISPADPVVYVNSQN